MELKKRKPTLDAVIEKEFPNLKEKRTGLDLAIQEALNELPEEEKKEITSFVKQMSEKKNKRWHFDSCGTRGSMTQVCHKFQQDGPHTDIGKKVYIIKKNNKQSD